MTKIPVEGFTELSPKEKLKIRANERIHTFTMANGQMRGKILQATHLIREMQANHNLEPLETMILGHAYMGTILLASNLKEQGRLLFTIRCEGVLQGLSVEADTTGAVSGCLLQNPIPVDELSGEESFSSLNDLSPLMGEGTVSITRKETGNKEGYTGTIELKPGGIGDNLAHYYLESEQIPSLFNLSVHFDNEGKVAGAGALFLQAMPEVEEEILITAESVALTLPSIGEAYASGESLLKFLDNHFWSFKPDIKENKRIEFFCPCQKKRFGAMLNSMQDFEKQDILATTNFPLEVVCHNCNSRYHFEKEEVIEIFEA